MRKLSEEELTLIQKSIIRKEISATELLAEIYDHYVSHLETILASEFHTQLSLLDLKWTQEYCKQLQRDLQTSINKSIRSLQWQLAKSYFSWPRMIFTLSLLVLISYLITSITWKLQVILFILPLLFLLTFGIVLSMRSYRNNKEIKKIFNFRNSGIFIMSFQNSNFLNHITLPLHAFTIVLLAPRIWAGQNFAPDYILNGIGIAFGLYLILHSVTILEAWKIKSKSALI